VVAAASEKARPGVSFGETLRALRSKRTFWCVAFAAATKAFIGYGHAPFTASFFLRNHKESLDAMAASTNTLLGSLGMSVELKALGFLSLALALMVGFGGSLGSYLGGWIADRYGARDLRAYVTVPGVASLVTIPIYVFAVTTDTALLGITLLAFNALLATLWYGPVYATAQSIVPAQMRATSAAILLFVINLIGLGLGPLAVGVLSDVFAGPLGFGSAEGIRWALVASSFAGVIAFACFWGARTSIREEMVG
jgi:MFS family permease